MKTALFSGITTVLTLNLDEEPTPVTPDPEPVQSDQDRVATL
jgi:hypothetical protein